MIFGRNKAMIIDSANELIFSEREKIQMSAMLMEFENEIKGPYLPMM